jgi:arsenate reductase
MDEIGIDVRGQRPKNVADFLGKIHVAYLITVCANAEERCPVFPGVTYRFYWPMEDPAEPQNSEQESLERFRSARDALDRKIRSWLKDLSAGAAARGVEESRMSTVGGREH